MTWRTFISYNVVGAFVWAVGVTLAGYLLGSTIGDDDRQVPLPDHRRDHLPVVHPAVPRVAQGEEAGPRNSPQAQAEAEAAALHEVVEED